MGISLSFCLFYFIFRTGDFWTVIFFFGVGVFGHCQIKLMDFSMAFSYIDDIKASRDFLLIFYLKEIIDWNCHKKVADVLRRRTIWMWRRNCGTFEFLASQGFSMENGFSIIRIPRKSLMKFAGLIACRCGMFFSLNAHRASNILLDSDFLTFKSKKRGEE